MKCFLFVLLVVFVFSKIEFRKCTEFEATDKHGCALVDVPFDYSNPLEKISVFIVKVQLSENPKGQVWFFHGGPSLDDLKNGVLTSESLAAYSDFELYAVLQRGGELGTQLNCPESSNGVDELCVRYINDKWGKKMNLFSTTNAARDVNYLMDLNDSQLPFYLFGVSYGSYFMNRFLTIFGDKRKYNSVVFDSVFDPKVGQFQYSQFNYDHATRSLFIKCDTDTFCGAFFGDYFKGKSATRMLLETIQDADNKESKVFECLSRIGIINPTSINIKTFFILTLDFRTFFPNIVFKLNRCDSNDIYQLKRIQHFFKELDYQFWPGRAYVANIYYSEMYRQPNSHLLSKQELQKIESELISVPVNSNSGVQQYISWNKYPNDEFMFQYPNLTNIPTIIIEGEEDDATPLIWSLSYAKNTGAKIIKLPYTGHWSSLNRNCGSLINEFFKSDGKVIDETCIRKIQPYDFKVEREETKKLSNGIFGTQTPWE